MKVTRKDIEDKLLSWKKGLLTRDEVFNWANDLYFPGEIDFDDWEGEDDNSIANEIMSRLGMMDIDDYSEKDIPTFLEFLKTPIGQFNKGYNKFLKYI